MRSLTPNWSSTCASVRAGQKTAARIEQEYLAQMRDLRRSAKAMEYRLYLYHLKFPEWDDIPPTPPEEPASDCDPLLRWLSEEEYRSLPSAEKSQLALDRWSKRKKSPWDIGVEFEQYVGYRYETDGYRVIYYGAVKHMDDLGRDLICTKSGHTVVVQCKRWASAEKCIHENVFFSFMPPRSLTNWSIPARLSRRCSSAPALCPIPQSSTQTI